MVATPPRSSRLYMAWGSRRSTFVREALASSVSMRITSAAACLASFSAKPASFSVPWTKSAYLSRSFFEVSSFT